MTTNDNRWVETLTVTKLRTNIIVKYRQGHGFLLNTRNDGFWNSDQRDLPPPPLPRGLLGDIVIPSFGRGDMPPKKKRNKPAVRLTSNMYPLCSRMSNGDGTQLGCVAHTNLEYDLGSPYYPFTKVTGSNFLSHIILLYLYIKHRCCRRWCWCWKRLWKSFKRVRNAQTQACKQSERQTTAIHTNVKENITHKI